MNTTPVTTAKTVHLAGRINDLGQISPACAKRPRVIRAEVETWTICRDAVTCTKCRKVIAADRKRIEAAK